MNKMNKKGFTIVELVIVIAVIAILAGVLIPTFGGIIDRANESAAKQEAAAVYKEVYAVDLSDGKHDGKDNGEPISSIKDQKEGTTISYSVTNGTISFTYVNGDYTLSTADGTTWTVEVAE